MKTSNPVTGLFISTALLFFSGLCNAEITIGLFLDKQTQIIGENTPVVSITAINTDGPVIKDVHIGVISPENIIYEYANWNTNLQPWLPAFTVPGNFQLGNTPLFNLDGVPGGLTQGIWRAYFALTEPGTINITHLQLIDLNVIDLANSPNAAFGSRYGSVSMIRVETLGQIAVSGAGTFYQADTEFPNLVSTLEGNAPIIDQCVFNQTQSDPSNSANFTLTSLDAGNLSVTGNGTLGMDKNINPPYITYSVTSNSSFFDNTSSFTFSASGSGQVGAFNVTVPSTNVITVTNPSSSGFEINANQDFVLTWMNNNFGAGEVLAILTGVFTDIQNPSNSTVNSIVCRFVDDGDGVIPGPLLAQLQQSLPEGPGFELPVDLPVDLPFEIPNLNNNLTLTVNRTNYKFFTTADPRLDIGVATVSSGSSKQGSFK